MSQSRNLLKIDRVVQANPRSAPTRHRRRLAPAATIERDVSRGSGVENDCRTTGEHHDRPRMSSMT